LIDYAQEALDQIDALTRHYLRLNRPEAVTRLDDALRTAEGRIHRTPWVGLPAPRPYPALTRPGVAWIRSWRYWIGYQTSPALVIVAVFYDQADIPGRF
jgi:plasmid stabilization system protein ParE